MKGQVIARGEKTWMVRIPLGRDGMGKRKYFNKTVHGTKRDAEMLRTKALRELDTGTFVEPNKLTIATHLDDWLAGKAAQLASGTLEDYARFVDCYLKPALGQVRLSQLTHSQIQEFYKTVYPAKSARTLRYLHSVLHGALEEAVRVGALTRNPAKLVKLPRVQQEEMRAMTAAEATRFLAATADRWETLWIVLMTSGMRPGEALGLKWADLDGDRVSIQRSLWRSSTTNQWQLKSTKTPSSRRSIPLPPDTRSALMSHRQRQLKERMAAGPEWANHDLIFASAKGEPLDWRVIASRHYRPVLKRAGLTGFRPYDLRHTHATLLLANDVNVKVVSERLGHKNIQITLNTYSHVLPDMQQVAADKLQSILFGEKASGMR